MAAAAGPFRTSTDSMSFGLMSDARLVWVVPSISPDVSPSTRLKLVVEKLELSMGTPSTTKSGCAWPVPGRPIVRWPRMVTYDDAPGSPPDWVTLTLGAWAARAWTTLGSLARWSSSPETLLRTA